MLQNLLGPARCRVLVTIGTSLILAGSLAIAAYTTYRYHVLQQDLLGALDGRGRRMTALFAQSFARPLYEHNRDALRRALLAASQDPDVAGVAVLDVAGDTLGSTGDTSFPPAKTIVYSRGINYQEDSGPSAPVGALVLGLSRQDMERQLRERLIDLCLSNALLTAVFLIVAAIWIVRLRRPGTELVAALGKLAANDTAIHLSGLHRDDEIGNLARLLWACRDTLLQHRKHEEELQPLVAERHVLLNGTPVGVLTERAGIIVACNRRLEEIFGYGPGELLGRHHRVLFAHDSAFVHATALSPASNEAEFHEVELLRRNGDAFGGAIAAARGGTNDGQHGIWIYLDSGRRKDESESRKRVASISADEPKRAAPAIGPTVRPASLLKAEFLPNMSHELRTPLKVISAMAEASLHTTLDAQQRGYLNRIRVAASSLQGVINDILDYSRIEAGKLSLDHLPFDLDDTVSGIAALLSAKAEEKGMELVLGIDPSLPATLIGDPLRLGQIISNLVGNAIKFSRHGDIVVSVREKSRANGHIELHFSVTDQGPGLTSDQQVRLSGAVTQGAGVTPLRTADKGLGLAICRHLVEIMGGSIWLESVVGQGCIFHFTARFEIDGQGIDNKAIHYAQRLKAFAGCRVVVIDDNAASREIAGTLFAKLGFVPELFDSGRAMLARLAGTSPSDYLFCCIDWIMPDLDGAQVARLLRAHYGRACPPLLLLTAFSHFGDLRGSGRDFAAVVSKPFNLEQIFNHVASLLHVMTADNPAERYCAEWNLAARLKGKRILLVEGTELNQEILTDFLHEADMTVHVAGNGLEALQAVREELPDCILMDCRMPVMDGFEATARLRALGFARLPIIGLAANGGSRERETGLAAGMNDVINKPVKFSALLALLVKWTEPPEVGESIPDPTPPYDDEILPPLPAGLDVESGLRHLRGKRGLFLKALRMFRDSRGHQFQLEFRAAVAAEDWQTSERLAHSLKATAATIGANEVSAVAARLEAAIRGANFAEVQPLLAEVTDKLRAIVDGLSHIG